MHDEKLRQYIEKIEVLEKEKAQIQEAVKDVFSEAKHEGFDTSIMKKVIRLRKMKPEELDEQDQLLTTYREALGF